jgi:hypothetical protein
MTYAVVNVILAVMWLPVVHRRFLASTHLRWWTRDCLPPLFAGAVCAFAASAVARTGGYGAIPPVVASAACVAVTLALTGLSHAGVRHELLRWWRGG